MSSISKLTIYIYIPFLILAIFWSYWRHLIWTQTCNFDKLSICYIILSTILLLTINLVVVNSLSHKSFFRSITKILDEKIYPIFKRVNFIDIIILSICAGVCEEITFRGVIQEETGNIILIILNLFLPKSYEISLKFGIEVGIIPSAIFFGLAHTFSKEAINLGIWIAIMGILLGVIYALTKNIIVVIGCHTLYDALIMIYLKRYYEPIQVSHYELNNLFYRK